MYLLARRGESFSMCINSITDTATIISALRDHLPPTFARSAIPKLTGDIVAAGTVANQDSLGTGPAGLFYSGRKACYERELFLAWLEKRLTLAKPKSPKPSLAV